MLTLTVLTLVGFVVVQSRLSGSGADLGRLQISAIQMEQAPAAEPEEILISGDSGQTGRTAATQTERQSGNGSQTAESETGPSRMTLTFGGTVAIEDNVRKSCYSSDSRKYDFSLVMNLLRTHFQGDGSVVFLENLLIDNTKVNDTVAPASAAEMLSEGGVTMAAAGFGKAFEQELSGIASTRRALTAEGVMPLGLREAETDDAGTMVEKDGIRTALLSYTGMMSSSARKSMEKKGVSFAVAEADPQQIAEEIQEARSRGAQTVIVLMNWGKAGGKNPDKNQKALARQIAEAGADLIIGAGSRMPQAPEWISVTGGDGNSRQVLCVYSLGTLVSDNRKQVNRMSGCLLRVSIEADREKGTVISDLAYIPTYLWRYRQDGAYYYRCLAANQTPPDGMDSDQQKYMARAAETIAETLKDSGIRVVEQP